MVTTPLTHDQTLDIRSDCGDTSRPPLLGFAEIQRMHDTPSTPDRDVTVVLCLRRMLAKRSILVQVDQSIFDQTERLLKIWMSITGYDGGRIEGGVLTINDEQANTDVSLV